MTFTLFNTKEAALEVAIQEYLKTSTVPFDSNSQGLSFANYSTVVQPGADPVALVVLSSSKQVDKLDQQWFIEFELYGKLRLMLADTDCLVAQRSIKNWKVVIYQALNDLVQTNGISGQYLGIQLNQEFKSFQCTERPWTYDVKQVKEADSNSPAVYQGVLLGDFTLSCSLTTL